MELLGSKHYPAGCAELLGTFKAIDSAAHLTNSLVNYELWEGGLYCQVSPHGEAVPRTQEKWADAIC